MSKKNTLKLLSAGIVSGFIGQFIGDFIIGILLNNEEVVIQTEDEGYIAAIIGGGVVAAVSPNLDDFKSVLLSVGLYYVIFQSLLEASGKEILSQDDLLREFLIDVIIVYIIIKFKNEFIYFFIPQKENKKDDSDFGSIVLYSLVSSIVVTMYYTLKRYQNQNQKQ